MPTDATFGPRAVWLGVYDALSARIAAEAPVQGLWLSSNCASGALRACPDVSILSASDMLGLAQRVGAAVPGVPLHVDCDSGYGEPEILRYYTYQYCLNSTAASLCVEDKAFPKSNSFYADEQRLVPVEVMVERIRAMDVTRRAARPGLRVIARTEALVAGQDAESALKRLATYQEAGADALFVQARAADEGEFLEVASRWSDCGSLPLVCSPSEFPHLPAETLWGHGFGAVIHANQLLRASVRATRDIATLLCEPHRSLTPLEPTRIVELADLEQLVRSGPFEEGWRR